ncbi:MAG: cell division ATP-binding protein FtsE [Clostridia bacterium]|nr:cell division ATP-binding protein FtsE [Clostridia bacterium]
MIEFNNVTKIYQDNKAVALKNVSFHINKGEFAFLVGHSGAGKSSIIRMMLCEEVPTEGEVIVNGFNIGQLEHKEIPFLRRSIGVVFQDFRLLPSRTVYENVAFAMRIVGASTKQMRRRIPEVLSMVGLAHKARCYPNQLSGGEQQRVSMARALANNPSVLIADEPTGNLDREKAAEIMTILDNINKHGTTIVMATHAEKIVNDMQKRVISLDMGEIVSDEERGVYTVGV